MKPIPLTRGLVAIVDDSDFEWLNQWKWTALSCCDGKYFYAYRRPGPRNNRQTILMHHLIMGAPNSQIVDHHNFDTLDNRRINLRTSTRSQNNHNCHKKKNNRSGYKGVTFEKSSGRWRVRIGVNYKRIDGGRFASKEEAATVYDSLADKHFGDFSRTNKSLNLLCQP